ncbi:MAG: VanZ family protein [Planctomycetes bacterium]|nr:VanZ family protein [Planctomycetota bacterium]
MAPQLLRGILAAWLAAVLLVTLAPFWPLRAEPLGFAPASRLGAWDFALNIVLFLPAGALQALLGRRASASTAAAALLSLAIEAAQMWIPHRHPSQLDVLANAVGALAGAFAIGLMTRGRDPATAGRAAAGGPACTT